MPTSYEGGFPPYVRGSDTSYAAASSVRGSVAEQDRQMILRLITERGGLTCDEVEVITGLKHQTASARITELKRDKILHERGKRHTRSGRQAFVMVVSEPTDTVSDVDGYWD